MNTSIEKLLLEMNPPPCMVDMRNLLMLQYNRYICDEVPKIYRDKVDAAMLAWLVEKAAQADCGDNAAAWVDFLLALDTANRQTAADYINHLCV